MNVEETKKTDAARLELDSCEFIEFANDMEREFRALLRVAEPMDGIDTLRAACDKARAFLS